MKNIRLYTLLAFLLLAREVMAQNNCWDGSVAEAYAGGDGTPENPYQIATAEQLALLAQQTNNGTGGDACYILTDNICLNENPDVNPVLWTPIGHVVGNEPPYFTGRFDGNKMNISGLVCQSNTGHGIAGLFGCTNGAVIQNVTLQNCRLNGTQYTGALVGYAGLTDISGCYIDDVSVTCEVRSAGGLAGFFGLPYGVSQNSYDTCHIVDCHVNQGVTVYGKLSGGLVGEITEYLLWGPSVPTIVSNCTGNAVMMGTECVGGLVGFMRNGEMESCRCWNEVHSPQYAGGMVGMGISINFTDCQNGANVTGNYQSGGMVGKLYGGNILNCENYGWIYGGGAGGISKIGGMVGRYEPDPLLAGSPCENFIRNCHNYGDITGSSDEAGGIIGYAEGSCIEELFIVDCSNSGVVVDNAYLAGGIIGHNGYIVRILNVYNTASVGARIGVGGIVGELSLSQDRVINAYSTGELIHEIDNYVCPRGAIVGYSSTNDQFSSCYWLASDEYGSNGQGPELEYSSAFYPTTSPSAWQLETPMHNTDDLLSALNAGVDDIESSFPQLGTVSRWHEDFGMENGGFPMFGIYDALNELPSALSVTVYPNPAKEKITMDGIHPAEVQVYNALGQVVKTVRDANEISVADLSQGVYLLRITDAEGRVYTNKMMIQ
jgi:hypothetical protein